MLARVTYARSPWSSCRMRMAEASRTARLRLKPTSRPSAVRSSVGVAFDTMDGNTVPPEEPSFVEVPGAETAGGRLAAANEYSKERKKSTAAVRTASSMCRAALTGHAHLLICVVTSGQGVNEKRCVDETRRDNLHLKVAKIYGPAIRRWPRAQHY